MKYINLSINGDAYLKIYIVTNTTLVLILLIPLPHTKASSINCPL